MLPSVSFRFLGSSFASLELADDKLEGTGGTVGEVDEEEVIMLAVVMAAVAVGCAISRLLEAMVVELFELDGMTTDKEKFEDDKEGSEESWWWLSLLLGRVVVTSSIDICN